MSKEKQPNKKHLIHITKIISLKHKEFLKINKKMSNNPTGKNMAKTTNQ